MGATEYDKRLHFVSGLLISLVIGWFFGADVGMLAAMAAGAVKEIRDWLDYGGLDWQDMAYTWGGGVLGILILEVSWKF